MSSTVLIEAQYFPSLEYICAIQSFDDLLLEKNEWYVKQTFRNRCSIMTSQGVRLLTIPVVRHKGKQSITETLIDYDQKWQNNHWRTIQAGYGKAPFFEHYADQLKEIIYKPHRSLFDLNLETIKLAIKTLSLSLKLKTTETYINEHRNDYRNCIVPKKEFTPRPYYHVTPYPQVFGTSFVPNLSFIDLLLCEGPHAAQLIRPNH